MSRDLANNMLGFFEFDRDRTSMKGHPVFIAQYATTTCCRIVFNRPGLRLEKPISCGLASGT